MPELTNIGYIRDLCERHGFALSKGFGQNFIVNPSVCPRMIEASGIDKSWGVLEIGPGIGVLTKEAAKAAAKVVAVEVDTRLPALLQETLSEFENVEIVLGDVLKTDLSALIFEKFAGLKVAVVANLPYYITSPILMKLLEERLPIESITVMVQKEAADRIAALPGSRDSGAISLAVRYFATPQALFTVSPGSFTPPPKVTSAVIRLIPHKEPPVMPADEKRMFAIIKAAFSQRRKTAVNAISAGLSCPKDKVAAAVESLGKGAMIRPENMVLEDFAALSELL